MRLGRVLWSDQGGMIISAELVIIATVVVLGLVTGLACVQQALVAEFQDLAAAFRGLNQSYGTPTFRGCWKFWGPTSWKSGSVFYDQYPGPVGVTVVGPNFEIVGGHQVLISPNTGLAPGLVAPGVIIPGVAVPGTVVPGIIEPGAAMDALPSGAVPLIPFPSDPAAGVHGCDACGSAAPPSPMLPQRQPEIPAGPIPQTLPQQ